MKILCTIFSLGHGNGGHFYDCHAVYMSLAKQCDCRLLNIGKKRSPVFKEKEINFLKTDNLFDCFRFMRYLKEYSPDCIICFDYMTFFLARCYILLNSCKLVFVKCGGANSTGFIPNSPSMVVMSPENERYYKSLPWSETLSLIPNRVVVQTNSPSTCLMEKLPLPDGVTPILRICRINEYYSWSIEQSLRLVQKLNNELQHRKFCLCLVGVVESKAVEKKLLKQYASKDLLILTTDQYTANASRLYKLVKYAVCSGRGVFEALENGVRVVFSISKERLPICLTGRNFDDHFDKNFSPRCEFSERDPSWKKIIELLTSASAGNDLYSLGEKYSSKHIASMYMNHILKTKQKSTSIDYNFFRHFAYFIKRFL